MKNFIYAIPDKEYRIYGLVYFNVVLYKYDLIANQNWNVIVIDCMLDLFLVFCLLTDIVTLRDYTLGYFVKNNGSSCTFHYGY